MRSIIHSGTNGQTSCRAFNIHFRRLREAQGRQAGEAAFDELLEFVSGRNVAAAVPMESGREALLGFHRVDVPATLNMSFPSTNLMENVLRNGREATRHGKRWNEKANLDAALDGERAAAGGSGVPQDPASGSPPP